MSAGHAPNGHAPNGHAPNVHRFEESFEAAKVYEAELDKHFGVDFEIRRALRSEEKRGIDRIFRHKRSGLVWSVEYKTDHETARTGNAFVETTSVDRAKVDGWALTSQAQLLVYFVPQREYALVVPMSAVKFALEEWKLNYPIAPAMNRPKWGRPYRTLGLLVPVGVLAKLAFAVRTVEVLTPDRAHPDRAHTSAYPPQRAEQEEEPSWDEVYKHRSRELALADKWLKEQEA